MKKLTTIYSIEELLKAIQTKKNILFSPEGFKHIDKEEILNMPMKMVVTFLKNQAFKYEG